MIKVLKKLLRIAKGPRSATTNRRSDSQPAIPRPDDASTAAAIAKFVSHSEVTVGDRQITLDLGNQHERGYAMKCLTSFQYPQSDVDTALFQRLVKPGDAVLDAGANIGFTSLSCLAAGARKVVAVEPVPALYQRLARLEGDGISTVEAALSSQAGRASITVSQSHNQGSTLHPEVIAMFPWVFGDAPSQVDVEVTTIDHLVAEFGAFDVWKLDIEGSEPDAITGAAKTLAQSPPRIIIAELWDDFVVPVKAALAQTHPHCYRAVLDKTAYRLRLIDGATADLSNFHFTSPMYVFSTEALSESADGNG